jgi:hypothetical protein
MTKPLLEYRDLLDMVDSERMDMYMFDELQFVCVIKIKTGKSVLQEIHFSVVYERISTGFDVPKPS